MIKTVHTIAGVYLYSSMTCSWHSNIVFFSVALEDFLVELITRGLLEMNMVITITPSIGVQSTTLNIKTHLYYQGTKEDECNPTYAKLATKHPVQVHDPTFHCFTRVPSLIQPSANAKAITRIKENQGSRFKVTLTRYRFNNQDVRSYVII